MTLIKKITLGLLLLSNICHADQWTYPHELVEKTFTFNDTQIIRIFDGRKTPEYRTKILYKGVEQANIKNLTFDAIKPYYNGRYFLGVSNSGISNFAYFIISAEGNLIKTAQHSSAIKYCQKSITILRNWVDVENMEIYEEFEAHEFQGKSYDWLIKVSVKACDGSKYEVWSPAS